MSAAFLLKHDSIYQKLTQYIFIIIKHIFWRARLAICVSSLMMNTKQRNIFRGNGKK